MLPNKKPIRTIFTLTKVSCDIKERGESKAKYRVLGYFDTLDQAVDGISKWVEIDHWFDDEEDDVEEYEQVVYPDLPPTIAFLIEEKEMNKLGCTENVGTRLYASDGTFLDEEMVSYAHETIYRGRPKSKIRFAPGDSVIYVDKDRQTCRVVKVLEAPPTPETYQEYDMKHPFLEWIGDVDRYIIKVGKDEMFVPVTSLVAKSQTYTADLK